MNDLENPLQIITETAKQTNPEIATKNKWLYPTDEFGKMEKGIVYESITYVYELNKNNTNDLVILTPSEMEEIKELENEK